MKRKLSISGILGILLVFGVLLFTGCPEDNGNNGGDNNNGSGSSGSAPSIPSGVNASAESSSSITVTWSSVSGATAYYVYRASSSSGTYSYRGPSPVASYTDTELSANTTYYYKVSAYNSYGESSKSSSVSATTTSGGNNNGGNNNGGNNDTRGFLEILYGEAADNNNNTQEGVYVGIISFAGDAEVITEPVRLNAAGYNTLKNKIANDYIRANVGSTSMFLAVHKALANLKANENIYPANLDTVSIITFTDGLDNNSLALLANPKNESKPNYNLEDEAKNYNLSDPASGDQYMEYIKNQIDTRLVAGLNIKAYAVGIEGIDVEDTASFDASLPKIASNGQDETGMPYYTKLTDFSELKGTFQDIANGLNVTHTNTSMVMTTTQNSAGTKYRWTFDAAGGNSAANSSKYIEATIAIDASSGDYSLKEIIYEGGISTTEGNGPVAGIINSDGNVDFTFTNVTGYDSETEQKPKQWIKRYGSNTWGSESEIDSTGNANKTVEHKTAIIYLVLDASTSLKEENIISIKSAISSGSGSNSGSGGNTGGTTTVPSAPTGVSATALSSSSITVTWSSVSGATAYYVYRASSSSGTYSYRGTSTSTTSYTDTGLSANTTYYYKVSAYNSYGEGSQSSYNYATTSSGGGGSSGYAGSSASNPIALSSSSSTWTGGTLSFSSPEMWYRVSVPNSSLGYYLSGRDSYDYGDPYTADIVFDIYDSESNLIKASLDAGNGDTTYYRFTSSGTFYVKVKPYNDNSNYYGTYAIYFF